MRSDIESVLRNTKKADVPSSTFTKVDDVLRNLEHRKDVIHMKPRYKKSVAVAAILSATLLLSTAVFAQDIIDYIKILTLGDHATYMVMAPKEITEEERRAAMAEMQARIDAGEITIEVSSSSENQEKEWLTFTDAEEGKNQFYTNVMLPTELPDGFTFKHIFYFVKSLEGLQEDGANKYMGVVYSDGTNEIRMQIRHMDETTGFESVADADTGIRTLKINGHEAIIDDSTLDVLIDDTMYMFFGRGLVGEAELVKMAQSLR